MEKLDSYLHLPQMQVVVDLSLCGARTGNYARSEMFGGRSSVESAVREMMAAGVRVMARRY